MSCQMTSLCFSFFTRQEYGQPWQSFLSYLYSLGLSAPIAKLVVTGVIVLGVFALAYIICWWIMSGIDHENTGKYTVEDVPFDADGPYCPIKASKEKKW